MQNLKSLTHKEVKKRCALEVNAVAAALGRVLYINAKRQAVLREQASRLRHCVFTVGALLAGALGIYGAYIY